MQSVTSVVIWVLLQTRDAAAAAEANANATAPLSIPSSGYFDGDDGWWSSFQVQVGNPGQTVRILPGTSASAGSTLWVVLPEGCGDANPGLANCSDSRGQTFTRNASSSWSTQRLSNGGLFQLNTFEESYLGLTGNGYYGFDTVSLGSGIPTLQNQLIAGIGTNSYWLGSLGLSPLGFNITTLNDPIPSLLSNLRNESLVPSLSWAYTAGASYQSPPSYGSLTLGGYDKSRFDPNTTLSNVPFGADLSRDLVVQLQTITYNTIGSSPLLADSIYVFLDSMVTQLWLPVEVCKSFEKAFNLTWNSTTQLYLIDEDVHSALVAQNPTFTFTLASTNSSSQSVEIVLPYAAFDLNVTQPVVADGPLRYFPLQQAQNSSQYTLGRVFLQEAYIVADYERHNFSVSQALFPSSSTPKQLVSIVPPGVGVEETDAATLSGGAIAGIVVGAVVLLTAVIAGLVWLRRRARQREQQIAAISADHTAQGSDEKRDFQQREDLLPQPELDSREACRYEMDQRNMFRPELSGEGQAVDRDGRYGSKYSAVPHEMGVGEVAAAELEAPSR